jgi:hypothetical protein
MSPLDTTAPVVSLNSAAVSQPGNHGTVPGVPSP